MVLEGHHGAVRCVTYSPDGKTLASTGTLMSITLLARSFQINIYIALDLVCTSFGLLCVPGSDGTLKLWQMSSKMCSSTVRNMEEPSTDMNARIGAIVYTFHVWFCRFAASRSNATRCKCAKLHGIRTAGASIAKIACAQGGDAINLGVH